MERTNIFNEIVETESKYLDSLTQLNTIYIQQIQSKKFFELKKDMNETVKNLSIIINFNGFLLKGLKEETAKENVGAIFCKIIPFLKTYTAYFNHYTGATSQVREERKKNKAFDEWLKKTETAAKKDGKQPFLSYLIMPVQRIPRYSLLLKELKGSTDQSHPDYPNLDKALDETKKVADYLNERIKDQDLQSRMLFIERNVMNMGNYEKVSLTAPHRRFVHELVVVFDDMEQVQLFVFSDLLLVCSKASEEQRTQYLMYHDNAKNGVNSGSQSARRKSGKRQSSSLSNIDTKNAPEFCIMFFIELSCTPAPSVQNFAGFPSRSNVLLLSTENESHLIVAQDKESAAELEACLTKVLAKLVSNAGLDPSDKSNYAPVSYYNLPSDMVEYVIQQNQIATSSPITPVEEKHTKIVLDSPSEASSSDSTSPIVPQIQLTADSSAESIFGERKRAPLDVVTKTKMKTPRRKATVQKSPVDILDTLENKVELPDSNKKFAVEEALVKVEEELKDNVPKAARFGGIAMPGMGMPGLGDALKRRQAKMEEKAEPEQKSEPVETKSEPEPASKPVETQPETQQVEQTPVEPIQVEVKQPQPVVETKDSPTDSPTQEGGRRRKKKLELKQKQKQQEKERLEKEKRKIEEETNRQQQEQAAAEEEERKKQEIERIAAEEEERKRQEAQQQAAAEEQRKLEELEKERVENEKAAQEKVEKERLEREANEKLERERTENEEAERLERERLEKERVEKEETERLEKKRAEVEEAQRLEKQRLEAEREQLEKDEAQRIEDEKLETQRIESERLEKERLEADKLERERLEKQRLEEEILEKERIEKERLAKLEEERLEKERIEQERLEKEKLERERVEQERVEQQRLQKEQDERDRLQRLKEEQEAASEAERQLLIQIEKERVEREEARRIEAERLKAERIAEKKRQYEREQALIREQELLELMRQKKEEQDKRERERIEQQRQQQLLEEEDRKKLQSQLNEILSNIKRVEKKIREEKDSAENWMKEAKKQGTTLFQLKTTNEQLKQQIDDARHSLSRDESVNNERVNSFEERIANAQNEIEGYKKRIEEEKAASDELSARESHLNEELRKIESRIDKERALQADMKSERVKFNKLSADVNIELVKYGSRLTRENTSKVALDKELADLQMNLDREKKLISRLEDQLKKEQLDREELYEEVQSATQEYKETESENAKLFEQLSFLKGQLTGQTKSKSTSKYDLETQTYQLQRLIRDAEYKLDREKQDQKTSLQQKRKIELQLEQVREEVEELREETSSLQQSIVDNEKDIDKFNSKIDEHMTKQIMMKREIEKLKNLERDLSSKITNAEFEIRKESREIQSLRAQLRALEMRASITPFNY